MPGMTAGDGAFRDRADAAYADGSFEAAISTWEELFDLQLAEGRYGDAAQTAATIALYLLCDTGLMAAVRGWVRRAERLLADDDENPARAVLAMVGTYERFLCGDEGRARELAQEAIRLGKQLGVPAAAIAGRVATARLTIADGRIDEGVAALDDIAVELSTGEVDPLASGIAFCEIVCAVNGLGLHDRAREWTDMMERWRQGHGFGAFIGRCRVHRAELLRISGPIAAAEDEALRACEELRPWMRREYGWPLAELGTIRLRRGDLAGAEECFVAAHQHGWSPHPGLALLRMAQGDTAAAAELIGDAIAHPSTAPSKEQPPFGDLRLAPLLDAQAQIADEAGDVATVRRAADALTDIASRYPSMALQAAAAAATARALQLEGDRDTAIGMAADAARLWADLDAPFELAMSRIVLGRAHEAQGHADVARMEWRAARDGLTAFGATFWADRVPPAAVSRGVSRAGLEAAYTRRGADYLITVGEIELVLPDLVGLAYLARLLEDPGREFHALDLVAVSNGTLPARPGERGLEVLDEQAIAAYRRRLSEIEEDLDEAREFNDLGRVALAESDRDFIVAQLSGALGLAGRRRTSGGSTERARTAVTRSLRYAIARVDSRQPELGRHFSQAVRTGVYCSYQPDPLAPIRWLVSRS